MSTEPRVWGQLSPNEQIERLDAQIYEAEAQRMAKTARAHKAHKLAIMVTHTDANGSLRLAEAGGGGETNPDREGRGSSERRAEGSQDPEGGRGVPRGRGASGASAGHRRRYHRNVDRLNSGSHYERYLEAKSRLGIT